MNLRDFGRTLLRRWYFTLLALMLAVGSATGVYARVGSTYSAGSILLLLPPASAVTRATTLGIGADNPLMHLGGLNESRDLLTRSMNSQVFANEMQQMIPFASFAVTGDSSSSAPLLAISADSKNPAGALQAMHTVSQQAPKVLADLQGTLGVKQDSRITVLTLTEDTEAEADNKKQLQLTIMIGVGMFAGALLLLALLDGWLLLRRNTGGAEDKGQELQSNPPSSSD